MRITASKRQLAAAIKTAKAGTVKKAKVAAIAFTKSGEIITQAANKRIDGCRRFSEHAEEGVVRKLIKLNAFVRYDNITILVIRVSGGKIRMAKPCVRCQRMLRRYPISVRYSDTNGNIKELDHEVANCW